MLAIREEWTVPIATLELRLDNWGEAWRSRLRSNLTQRGVWSTRRGYGNAWHWDASDETSTRGVHIGSAPSAPAGVDMADAQAVELAVGAVEIFHHVVLKGHYVRQWDPEKTLRTAKQASGLGNPRRRGGDYQASLRMARALLAEVIDRPAVIRRGRAARAAAFARGIRRNGWWVKRPDADPLLVRVFDAQDLATMQRLYSNAELTPE